MQPNEWHATLSTTKLNSMSKHLTRRYSKVVCCMLTNDNTDNA
jgi:hypothetical protein